MVGHFEFTRINIEPTILRKKIEDLREAGATLLKRCGVCQDQPTGLVALANFFGVLARGSHKPTARVREG